MKTVPAAKFKEQCLALLDQVDPDGIIITKHGKPVVKLVPVSEGRDDIFGFLKGKGKVTGDVVSPALTPEEWGDLY